MSEALRFNEGKPKLSYFMRSFRWMTAAVARVKEFGANKYEEDNWRAGNKPDEEYLDSCMRHLDYFFGGEFYDADSGCSHIAHAVWNLSAMMELNYVGADIIDEDLFANRMDYWAEQKKLRKLKEAEEPYCRDNTLDWNGMPEPRRLMPGLPLDDKGRPYGPNNPLSRMSEEDRQRYMDDSKWDGLPEFIAPRGVEEAFKREAAESYKPEDWQPEPVGRMPDEPTDEERANSPQGMQAACTCGGDCGKPSCPLKELNDTPRESLGEVRVDGEKVADVVAFEFHPEPGSVVSSVFRADVVECPKCGSDDLWDYYTGDECMTCGEIFNVPIGAEEQEKFDGHGEYADPVIPAEYCEDSAPLTENKVLAEWPVPEVPMPARSESKTTSDIVFEIKDAPRSEVFNEFMAKLWAREMQLQLREQRAVDALVKAFESKPAWPPWAATTADGTPTMRNLQ